MKDYDRIKKMIRSELAEMGEKGSMSHSDVETIYKLIDIMKDISTIEAMDDGYSRAGYSGEDYNGDYSGTYTDRSGRRMYSREGRDYSRDYDSRDGGYSYGRHYVRGHYSYADEKSMIMEKIEDMLDDSNLSLDDKSALKKAMGVLRK